MSRTHSHVPARYQMPRDDTVVPWRFRWHVNMPYCWWQSEPHWWRNQFKTRLRRAEVRRKIHDAMTADPDEVLWPEDKRPWVYYW